MFGTTSSVIIYGIIILVLILVVVALSSVHLLGSTIQVFVAIAIVIIMFVIAFSVYNMEFLKSLQDFGRTRIQTTIFSGIKDLNVSKDETYNTTDVNSPLYLNLDKSYNQTGGTEYSYNFWLYLDPQPSTTGIKCTAFNQPTSDIQQYTDRGIESVLDQNGNDNDTTKKPIILFMRGDKNPYYYTSLCNATRNGLPADANNNAIKTDLLVKSPLVKLEQGCNILTVEFNTYASPDAVKQSSRDTCNDTNNNWEYMNSYKVGIKNLQTNSNFTKNWFMVSIVLQDTLPTDPYPIRNKIRCVIYVNGTPELDRYIDGKLGEISTMGSIIKLNSGNFYVNPIVVANNVYYHNGNNINLKSGKFNYTDPSFIIDQSRSIMMADLNYFNYALTVEEILALYNMGITKKYAPVIGAQNTSVNNDFMKQISYATNKKNFLEINQQPPSTS